jgi:hypothetical protein
MAILDCMETASKRSLTQTHGWSVGHIGLWLALSFGAFFHAYAEPVAIVPRGEVHPTIERKTLRAAFGMTLQVWPDGRPLTVFVFRDDDVLHQQFCRKVLGILPYTLRRNWDRLLFSGAAQAPIAVDNPQEMLRRVASTPGAIGYIEKESTNESVSIVEIAQ